MLTFQNPGLIPIEGFTTLGINVKEGDSPIGHFGTGLKIAIANIIREGGSITIYRGLEEHRFGVERRQIRGKDFDIITLGGQVLGFTTELGKNWQPWMTMRELESNCRDENGHSVAGELPPREGMTTIHVQHAGVLDAYYSLDDYFINSLPVESIKGAFEVHRKPSKYFYLRGIRVGEFPETLPFTINFTKDFRRFLTEDRTVSEVSVRGTLAAGLISLRDPGLLHLAFPPEFREDSYLRQLDYDMLYPALNAESIAFFKELFMTNMVALPLSMQRMLTREGVLNIGRDSGSVPMTDNEKTMIDRAREYLIAMGYSKSTVESVRVIKGFTGENVYAIADKTKDQVIMGSNAFDMGQKFVCTTLHEEVLHLRYNLHDCSREFQNHILNKLATVMEDHYFRRPL